MRMPSRSAAVFALALASNRVPGVVVDLPALAGSPDLAAARPRVVETILQSPASPATETTLERAASLPQLVALALGAPEYPHDFDGYSVTLVPSGLVRIHVRFEAKGEVPWTLTFKRT